LAKRNKAQRQRTVRRPERLPRPKHRPAAVLSARRRGFLWLSLASIALFGAAALWWPREIPVWGFRVVQSLSHDAAAFTQGLLLHDGYLYESTGKRGSSELRKVEPSTGEVVARRALPFDRFGEGLALAGDRFYQLTWGAGEALLWDRETLEPRGVVHYEGAGWGLTYDGRHLVMSDGSARLRFLEPETFEPVRSIEVTFEGDPVKRLNELEWIEGRLWANVWRSDRIAVIDPDSGEVVAWLDLAGLHPNRVDAEAVLNGIAWDAATNKLYLAGKWWDRLYQIEVLR